MTKRKRRRVKERGQRDEDKEIDQCRYCRKKVTTVTGVCTQCGELHKERCDGHGCRALINKSGGAHLCKACEARRKRLREIAEGYDDAAIGF